MESMEVLDTVAENTRRVMEDIRQAAERSGRNPNAIKLLAASKMQDVEKIRAAAKAGIRLFGENYVQEVKAKQEALEESVEWHMIGHLQRNKALRFSRKPSSPMLPVARRMPRPMVCEKCAAA